VEEVARRALEAVDADLNALTMPLVEPSLGHDPDGPFGGVPFVIKDSSPFAHGVPFALGSRGIRGVARRDHPMMERFRAAGLVTLGQSTAPELSLSFATESLLNGATNNPWALGRGVGGSSGGAAALVASGAVPVAHGNDGAGSLRIPASCCGLVGLKPSRGRTPDGPGGPAGLPVGIEFALSRTVRDTAHLLQAVGSAGGGGSFVDHLRRDPGRLRIAHTTGAWSGVAIDPQVAGVTVAAAGVLEWIGHSVAEGTPAIDHAAVVEAELLGVMAAGTALLGAPVQPDHDLLEAVSRRVLAETRAFTPEDWARSARAQAVVTGTVDRFFESVDLLVTPTLGQLPSRHGELDYDNPEYSVRDWLRRIFEYGPFTAPFNVSGHPAISLPLGESREGLPIGVQLVARRGREDVLIRVSAQLEQAMPWSDRQPSVFAQ
jgi:amidase